MSKLKVAALDMNNAEPNMGFASILRILKSYNWLEVHSFDVRAKGEIPDLSYDIYISSGGPGSPLPRANKNSGAFFKLMDAIWQYNQQSTTPKFCFFICHSFQMICDHLKIGQIAPRKSEAFGVFPVHMTAAGKRDPLFEGLSDPFYAADFRKWQLIQPDKARLKQIGANVLALEKIRPHVDLERAVMAIRFSPTWVGVQFHPEAEPGGMFDYFSRPERKKQVIESRGERKYAQMIGYAKDETKLRQTYLHVLPGFLERAREILCSVETVP